MLKFDKQGLANEILKNLEIELQDVFEKWKEEVENKMRNIEFKQNAVVEKEITRISNSIIVYLRANTYVLADSYGTGSLMLSNNPGFQNYIKNTSYNSMNKSGSFNPLRTGKAIMGRPRGFYIDVFGKRHETSGAFAGKNIEGMVVNSGKKGKIFKRKYRIEPVAPSYTIQLAEQWLYATHLPRAYKLAIQRTNFSKYLKEVN